MDPFEIIKRLIGWERPRDKQSVIQQTVIRNYNKYVQVSETDSGAIPFQLHTKTPNFG